MLTTEFSHALAAFFADTKTAVAFVQNNFHTSASSSKLVSVTESLQYNA
jgi:hypothetical protein